MSQRVVRRGPPSRPTCIPWEPQWHEDSVAYTEDLATYLDPECSSRRCAIVVGPRPTFSPRASGWQLELRKRLAQLIDPDGSRVRMLFCDLAKLDSFDHYEIFLNEITRILLGAAKAENVPDLQYLETELHGIRTVREYLELLQQVARRPLLLFVHSCDQMAPYLLSRLMEELRLYLEPNAPGAGKNLNILLTATTNFFYQGTLQHSPLLDLARAYHLQRWPSTWSAHPPAEPTIVDLLTGSNCAWQDTVAAALGLSPSLTGRLRDKANAGADAEELCQAFFEDPPAADSSEAHAKYLLRRLMLRQLGGDRTLPHLARLLTASNPPAAVVELQHSPECLSLVAAGVATPRWRDNGRMEYSLSSPLIRTAILNLLQQPDDAPQHHIRAALKRRLGRYGSRSVLMVPDGMQLLADSVTMPLPPAAALDLLTRVRDHLLARNFQCHACTPSPWTILVPMEGFTEDGPLGYGLWSIDFISTMSLERLPDVHLWTRFLSPRSARLYARYFNERSHRAVDASVFPLRDATALQADLDLLWSFGLLLAWMLTGTLSAETAARDVERELTPRDPALATALSQIVRGALHQEGAPALGNMDEVIAALETAVEASTVAAAPKPTPPHIFLSHAHLEKALVRRVAHALTVLGAQPILDETDLSGIGGLPKALASAIESSDALLLLGSPASLASRWVEYEASLSVALSKEDGARHRGPVIATLEPLPHSQLPPFLRSCALLDLSEALTHEGDERLVEALRRLIAGFAVAVHP